MDREALWSNFVNSGRVEDYLRYKQGGEMPAQVAATEAPEQYAADRTWSGDPRERERG